MNGLPYIEISAALMGVIGTLLLAGRSRLAGWGFVAYLVSNAGWLRWRWHGKAVWHDAPVTICYRNTSF